MNSFVSGAHYVLFLLLNKMMSPADILSAQAAASLQRDSLKYDLVGSPSKRDDIGTVYPAYNAQRLQVNCNTI